MTAIQYGTAFYFNNRPGNNHLHFVISDPTQPEILIVNMTTPRVRSDKSCLLQVGDCSAVEHESRIAYEFAEIISTETLQLYIDTGSARFVENVPDAVLQKIWDGAIATSNMTLRNSDFLRNQGLII